MFQSGDSLINMQTISNSRPLVNEKSIKYLDSKDLSNLKQINNKKVHPLLNGMKIWDEWCWDTENRSQCVSLSENNKLAYFFDNPYTISRGTVAVRGKRSFKEGIRYFEILVKEPLYGTAVMIGLGTDDTCLHYENFDYVNLVGNDQNSWGLCHKGTIHHDNKSNKYCEAFFDKDSVIGVLYNANNKSIHYFLNGKYLGLAFKNVNPNNKDIYPIIASTATDIELELIGSYKIIYSLEDICCQHISNTWKNYDKLPLSTSLINNIKEFSAFS